MKNKIKFPKIIAFAVIIGLAITGLTMSACSGGGGLTTEGEEIWEDEPWNPGGGGQQIGTITGTITFTDVPSPAPEVFISFQGYNGYDWWNTSSCQITLSGSGTLTNVSWSIPIYSWNNFSASEVNFYLYVYPAGSNGGFSIKIPETKFISSENDYVGSLGVVSLKFITLSGTINVTYNGQTVPRVSINAYDDNSGSWLGSTSLESPGANASWSIPTQALDSSTEVRFSVYGYSDEGKYLFGKEITPNPPVTVYNTNVSGINLNVEDIATITMSGTINATHNGQAVKQVEIIAYDDNSGSWLGSTSLESPGANASWSITMEALISSTNVRFYVYGYSDNGQNIFNKQITPNPPVTVYNTDVSGINLNVGDIATITMSGTINVTYNGQTVPNVSIQAESLNSGNWLGNISLNSPGANASWSMTFEPLDYPTEVRFYVNGHSNNWEQLFSRVITPNPAVTVHNTNVSGINLNLGNISNTPEKVTALSADTWVNGEIVNGGDVDWYSINVTGGSTYYLWWNDSYQGDGSKSLDIDVYAYNSSINPISLSNTDSAWSAPNSFTASSSGTVYLRVRHYSGGSNTGTYSIVYNTSGSKPSGGGGAFTVSFNSNGGSGTVLSMTASYGESITLPNGSGLSYSGYTFGGWNTNSAGTGTNYNAGASYTVTASVMLYAKWNVTGGSNLAGSEGNPIPLSVNTWTDGTITSSAQEQWYSFNVTSGSTYYVWWNDSYQGSGDKSIDVVIDAVYSNGTSIFTYADSGWTTAQSFTANQTGTVKIKVYPYYGGSTGTFAVAYSTSSTRPGSSIEVTFNSLTANGNTTQTTTQLTLTFSQAIAGLTAADITLSGVTGVQRGSLNGSGTTYTLSISGFTNSGTLNVSVSKSGYTINDSPKSVNIYYTPPPVGVGIVINLAGMNEWQLTDQSAQASPDVNKTFTVNGSYSTYRWYLDGMPVGINQNYTFNRPAGVYQLVVVVTNSAGESRSGRCWITVSGQ